MNDLKWDINWTRTRSVWRYAAAHRGGERVERAGRGGGRTRGRSGDQGDGRNDGPGGQVGGQGSEVNGGVDGVPDFSTIIAQQLQNLLPTIVAQVGNQVRGQGVGRNQNGDAVNDHIRGDVGNATEGNDRRGCTYKEFLACNPKEYDGKGGAIVYTRWIEKMESVHDMSGCRDSDVSLCTDTPYLLDGYGVLGKSSLFFFVDQSIVCGVSLMWIRRILQSQAMVF
ncbi:hypothetical protein Tco_0702368 [Tanacetum coccineum]|uniref:Reverse transcriptase domain-containing protein n=1 Tax=Tanacetum coccineum TaxID=301880 RepID=A0ABQ4XWK8_9ASTR